MHITLVKKILKDGNPCRKCQDVLARLEKDDLINLVDDIAIADERDPISDGMRLARKHHVDQAPFFIVADKGESKIYISYLKLKREVLNRQLHSTEEALELLQNNPGLDFI